MLVARMARRCGPRVTLHSGTCKSSFQGEMVAAMASRTSNNAMEWRLARLAAVLAVPVCTWFAAPSHAQSVPSNVPTPPPPDVPLDPVPLNSELQTEIQQLRDELNQSKASRDEVQRLRDEVAALRAQQEQQQQPANNVE